MATHSLFLLRELEILSQGEEFEKCEQRCFALSLSDAGVKVEQGKGVDDLASLVLLDEELAQSGRFMDAECEQAPD